MLRALWPFVVGSVALGLDAYVIAGLLPVIASDLGTSEAIVGLGVTAFTGAYAASGPLLSGSAGIHAQRSLFISILMFSLANIATAMSPSALVFIGTRVVAGAAAGVYSPLSSAVAAATVSAEQKGRALSLVLAGLALGTVLGVPVGLVVADIWGWRSTIAMISFVGVVALVGIGIFGRSDLPLIPSSTLGQRLLVVARPENLFTVLVTLFVGIASLGLYTYVSVLLEKSHFSEISGIWMWGLGGALGAFGIGRVLDQWGKPRKLTGLILGSLVFVYSLLLIFLSVPGVVGVCLFAWGMLGWASLAPQQHTLLSTNEQDGATAVAANASANYLGAAIGSALGAIVSQSPTGLLVGALTAVAMGAVCHMTASKLSVAK